VIGPSSINWLLEVVWIEWIVHRSELDKAEAASACEGGGRLQKYLLVCAIFDTFAKMMDLPPE
jgi:hypothetical protein